MGRREGGRNSTGWLRNGWGGYKRCIMQKAGVLQIKQNDRIYEKPKDICCFRDLQAGTTIGGGLGAIICAVGGGMGTTLMRGACSMGGIGVRRTTGAIGD